MIDLDAYFARINYAGDRSPTLATLRALHELHPAAIPFEAIDVLLDKGVDLSPPVVDAKLIGARRGGYCFELNGLFRRVLVSLGFQVEPLIARVIWLAPADAPPPPRTHMALRVTIDGERWLADVGFGGRVLTSPLRFDVEDAQPTAHERFRLAITPAGRRLDVELPTGWAGAYVLAGEVAEEMDFIAANWFTATHPSSRFRNGLIVARTTPQARYALADNRFTVREVTGRSTATILDGHGLERVLREVFGLDVQSAWRPLLQRIGAIDNGL